MSDYSSALHPLKKSNAQTRSDVNYADEIAFRSFFFFFVKLFVDLLLDLHCAGSECEYYIANLTARLNAKYKIY